MACAKARQLGLADPGGAFTSSGLPSRSARKTAVGEQAGQVAGFGQPPRDVGDVDEQRRGPGGTAYDRVSLANGVRPTGAAGSPMRSTWSTSIP